MLLAESDGQVTWPTSITLSENEIPVLVDGVDVGKKFAELEARVAALEVAVLPRTVSVSVPEYVTRARTDPRIQHLIAESARRMIAGDLKPDDPEGLQRRIDEFRAQTDKG